MPQRDYKLCLHEELLLIALRDDKGTLDWRAGMYHICLSAAILSELLLAERIAVTEDKKKLVEVVNAEPLGDPILDECLARIAESKRRQRLQTWVTRIAQTRRLRHRVAEALCRKGVLREKEDKVLWIFTRKLYPERDPRCERRIIERLRKAIFTETRNIDPRTVVLVSLAHNTGLLAIPFGKRDLRSRKRRIARITEGQIMGKAAGEAVRAAQAAIIAASAATAAATATSAACS